MIVGCAGIARQGHRDDACDAGIDHPCETQTGQHGGLNIHLIANKGIGQRDGRARGRSSSIGDNRIAIRNGHRCSADCIGIEDRLVIAAGCQRGIIFIKINPCGIGNIRVGEHQIAITIVIVIGIGRSGFVGHGQLIDRVPGILDPTGFFAVLIRRTGGFQIDTIIADFKIGTRLNRIGRQIRQSRRQAFPRRHRARTGTVNIGGGQADLANFCPLGLIGAVSENFPNNGRAADISGIGSTSDCRRVVNIDPEIIQGRVVIVTAIIITSAKSDKNFRSIRHRHNRRANIHTHRSSSGFNRAGIFPDGHGSDFTNRSILGRGAGNKSVDIDHSWRVDGAKFKCAQHPPEPCRLVCLGFDRSLYHFKIPVATMVLRTGQIVRRHNICTRHPGQFGSGLASNSACPKVTAINQNVPIRRQRGADQRQSIGMTTGNRL